VLHLKVHRPAVVLYVQFVPNQVLEAFELAFAGIVPPHTSRTQVLDEFT